jgi:hypothetical protein
MTFVFNLGAQLVKSLPVLVKKVGTILLLIFTIGLFSGYFISLFSIHPVVLLIPVVAMFVMWYRLDEGVAVLALLVLLVLFFPQVIDAIVGAVL